jgi:hypothetical protein
MAKAAIARLRVRRSTMTMDAPLDILVRFDHGGQLRQTFAPTLSG